jgi:hypothetical protein
VFHASKDETPPSPFQSTGPDLRYQPKRRKHENWPQPTKWSADAVAIPYENKASLFIKFTEADSYILRSLSGKYRLRKKMGDWVDILWYQLVFWGGLQWDPVRFPSLLYSMAKDRNVEGMRYAAYVAPWWLRPFLRALFPVVFVSSVFVPPLHVGTGHRAKILAK